MARVLAYTSPARGHLFPLTPVLDELRNRGHDIALRMRRKVLEAIGRRAGARRIAEAYRAAGGPPAAADAFEGLLDRRPEPSAVTGGG